MRLDQLSGGKPQECFSGLLPGNAWHAWLIDQLALTTIRLDRCGRADRRMRDAAAIRAGANWDEDRNLRAEVAGRRIAEVPRAAVAELRATPHGCDWLIRRWAILGRAAELGQSWTEGQVSLAHDLLGTPAEGRGPEPADPSSRVELASRQIAGLRRRKAEVMHWDAIERAMVEADLVVEPMAELRRLGRYEARLRGWLRWLVAQIQAEPPKRLPPAGLYPRLPEAEKKPEAAAEASPHARPERPSRPAAEESASEHNQEVESDPATVGRLPLAQGSGPARKGPRAPREAARSEARRRRRELRRA